MRGATVVVIDFVSGLLDFNPRAHEGRDIPDGKINKHLKAISIHAPMRGATFNFELV